MELSEDEQYERLLGRALNYVSIRPRTEKEIRAYLRKKIDALRYPESILNRTIERLSDLGYVDDARFAKAFIESSRTGRPKGKRRIAQDLLRHGIGKDSLQDALGCLSGEDEADLARSAAIKKLRSLGRYGERERRQRLFTFLLSRGFDSDTTAHAIDGLFEKEVQ